MRALKCRKRRGVVGGVVWCGCCKCTIYVFHTFEHLGPKICRNHPIWLPSASLITIRYIRCQSQYFTWKIPNQKLPGNSASVTFLGWLSDLLERLSHLQIRDEMVTLNHLVGGCLTLSMRSFTVHVFFQPGWRWLNCQLKELVQVLKRQKKWWGCDKYSSQMLYV